MIVSSAARSAEVARPGARPRGSSRLGRYDRARINQDGGCGGVVLDHLEQAQGVGGLKIPRSEAKDAPPLTHAGRGPGAAAIRGGGLDAIHIVTGDRRAITHARPKRGQPSRIDQGELLDQLVTGHDPRALRAAFGRHPIAQAARPDVGDQQHHAEAHERPAPRAIGADQLHDEQAGPDEEGKHAGRSEAADNGVGGFHLDASITQTTLFDSGRGTQYAVGRRNR